MADPSNSRAAILSSVRRSLGAPSTSEAIASEYGAIARTYSISSRAAEQALTDLFADRLREYDAGVYFTSISTISTRIAEILTARGKKSLTIPPHIPQEWLPQDYAFTDTTRLDAYQLDKTEGVLTGCTVAIAVTGSIVLQNAPAQGPRILSLVPDYHLCVVSTDQIVATVPEAFEKLQATSTLPTTFISGPSATADIEMTRIKGVHGPRFLDVLIVEG